MDRRCIACLLALTGCGLQTETAHFPAIEAPPAVSPLPHPPPLAGEGVWAPSSTPTPASTSTSTPTPASTPTSSRLASGWYNPLPNGVVGGYPADTGLDISGLELPVHAIAAGTLVYSESGHTLWTGPRDDDNAVLIELDEPVPFGDRRITHVWYAHLSRLDRVLADQRLHENRTGAPIHVAAGERLGISGRANGHPHLHLGLLLDGETRQYGGTFLLDSEIRAAMKLHLGQRLPR